MMSAVPNRLGARAKGNYLHLGLGSDRTPAHLNVRPASQVKPGAKPMKFRPLHDRVVISRIEGEDKTKGGIIIPDTVKEKPQEGEVIAAGPALGTRAASLFHSISKRATGCCSVNGPAPRSRSMMRT